MKRACFIWIAGVSFFLITIQKTSADSAAPLNFNFHQLDPGFDCDEYVFLYSHGLGATQRQAFNLYCYVKGYSGNGHFELNPYWIIKGSVGLFDYADAKNDEVEYYRKQVSLGQEPDVARLEDAYQRILSRIESHKKIIIVGVSRGAATIINWLALKKPSRIAAAILESPFDTLENVIKHILKRYKLHWIPLSTTLGRFALTAHFPAVDLQGIEPIKLIDMVDPNIPLLFVHSLKDTVIPIKSSRNLYTKLKERGHSHAYLYESKEGEHAALTRSNGGYLYHAIVQAFFKQYSLPYEAAAAEYGQGAFALCMPSIEDLKKRSETESGKKSIPIDLQKE